MVPTIFQEPFLGSRSLIPKCINMIPSDNSLVAGFICVFFSVSKLFNFRRWNNAFMTVVVILWKSERPVSITLDILELWGRLVEIRSLRHGQPGFLKHFFSLKRLVKLQNLQKVLITLNNIISPSHTTSYLYPVVWDCCDTSFSFSISLPWWSKFKTSIFTVNYLAEFYFFEVNKSNHKNNVRKSAGGLRWF